ncbi:MAG: di-trans,poly-cis-decaprenylcistransferase [Clostridiales bacterium]|nr:di-trans,poly-cis-decaprenylcistransferase [Clostridiales bacterium]
MQNQTSNGVKHIAFIMDGNGRWANKRNMPREYGHRAGAEKFKEIIRYCGKIGIETVTVYAFSTENWKRPKNEVNAIFDLLRKYIAEAKTMEDRVRVRFIGDISAFDGNLQNQMKALEKETESYTRTVCIAVNYGGHAEIVNAVNELIANGKSAITEEDITNTIYSGQVPPPDMIVRTGGEYRLSNFLLWQSSYAELFFTDVLWPDLSTDDVDRFVEEFKNRKRRFGGI